MFSKNLEFYRLKNAMTKKELAEKCQLTPMAITNYENGDRMPDMETIKKLAQALGVRPSDFLSSSGSEPNIQYGEFRKLSKLTKTQQDYVRKDAEDYLGRFCTTVDILGDKVLPDALQSRCLPLSDNAEDNARRLREHLELPCNGPVGQLVEILENKGILVYMCDINNDGFSGMNGSVNGRPFIILNSKMTPERKRSTAVHELAHFMFIWPEEMEVGDVEKMATAISGAFLFPREDIIRELGPRRRSVSGDMIMTAKEYGISMYMLAKRAEICEVISGQSATNFYKAATAHGWRKNEPTRIKDEKSNLLKQLVCRAVNEQEINMRRGAELLRISTKEMMDLCHFGEDVTNGTHMQ